MGMSKIRYAAALVLLVGMVLSGCGSQDTGDTARPRGTPFQYDGGQGQLVGLDSAKLPAIGGGAIWFKDHLYINVKGKGIMKASIQEKELVPDPSGQVLTKRTARDMSSDGSRVYLTNYYHTYCLDGDTITGLVSRDFGNFTAIPGSNKAYQWMENQPFRELTLSNGIAVSEGPSFLKDYSQFADPVHTIMDAVADKNSLYLLGTFTEPASGADVSAVYAFSHSGTFQHKYGTADIHQADCIAEGQVMALTADYVLVANSRYIYIFKNGGAFQGKVTLTGLGLFLPVHQLIPLEGNNVLLWCSGTDHDEALAKKAAGQPYDEEIFETDANPIAHFYILEL